VCDALPSSPTWDWSVARNGSTPSARVQSTSRKRIIEAFNRTRAPRRGIDQDDTTAGAFTPLAHLVVRVNASRHRAKDALGITTDDACIRSTHADIGDERGATWEDASIRGGHMGVRSNHRRHSPVEMMGERRLFSGCFHVCLDDDDRITLRERCDQGIGTGERVIRGKVHEDATEYGRDEHIAGSTANGGDANPTLPRSLLRQICRSANGDGGVIEQGHDSRFPKGVIPKRDRVESRLSQVMELIGGDARSAAKVLAVDHPNRGRVSLTDRWHRCLERAPPWLPDTISEEHERESVGHRYTLVGFAGSRPPVGCPESRTMQTVFKKGDRVRHPSRPEWGTGAISRIETLSRGGTPDMRIWVRFPGTGEKALLASAARLELVDSGAPKAVLGERPTVHELDMANGGGWLADVSKRKVDDVMVAVPDEALDPFAAPQRRLANILALYRFDGSPARLVEWAVAQSGLDDPMTRFNRQELEQFHKRWLVNLDTQLLKLLTELKRDRALVDLALKAAPPLAQRAVRRQLELVR